MKELTKKLEEALFFVTNVYSDIREHIPVLTKYSLLCDVVVEFGTDIGNSTMALLSGLPKKMICVDIVKKEEVSMIEGLAIENNVDFVFIKDSSPNVHIKNIDLLFIDSRHTYDHLSLELKIHSPFVNKYIIIHDTVTYANKGCGVEGIIDGDKGLRPAIDEFLLKNKEWIIKEELKNCNGLIILERNG